MTTASQAPVSLPSLQEMIAEAATWQDAHRRWGEDSTMNGKAIDGILALLQSIAAPDEAMVERLRTSFPDRLLPAIEVRAVLSALSGEAR